MKKKSILMQSCFTLLGLAVTYKDICVKLPYKTCMKRTEYGTVKACKIHMNIKRRVVVITYFETSILVFHKSLEIKQ